MLTALFQQSRLVHWLNNLNVTCILNLSVNYVLQPNANLIMGMKMKPVHSNSRTAPHVHRSVRHREMCRNLAPLVMTLAAYTSPTRDSWPENGRAALARVGGERDEKKSHSWRKNK